jgi:glycosyltransferase involved in cell wall biosynthesis
LNWRCVKNPLAGGAELFTFEIARHWARAGHEVTLFSSRFDNSEERETVDGVRFVRKGSRLTVYREARKYYAQEFRGKVDVVIDGINSIPFLTPLYVKERKVPVVFQLTKGAFLSALPSIVGVGGMIAEPLVHLLVYSRLPAIVLSESVRRELLSLRYSPSKIFVAEPGTDHLIGASDDEKSVQPTVLYLNRVVPYKNVHHLVRAFNLVRDRVPLARLIIAGCRGSPYEDEIRALVSSLGLGEFVEFLEFARGERKTQLLRRAWVHVLPSSVEGWGISATEAASCGTPTVAYNVPGLRDSVRNGETGFLVSRGDWVMLAKAITVILTNEGLRDRLAANASRWASSLTWDRASKLAYDALCA